ncbi:MAG: TrkH family potassium uptake protein [Clostridia bacterium]
MQQKLFFKTRNNIKKPRKGMRPIAILPLGFFSIIAIGTILLMLPFSSTGAPLTFVESLFSATTSVCVTGLTVIDPGSALTLFGQIVMVLLIQLGGLGFMAIATTLFMFLGKKVSLHDRMTIAESFGQSRLQGMIKLCLTAVKLTFSIELIGAFLLMIRFIPMYGVVRGAWVSIFTSISAFCNAGLDIFATNSSMLNFSGDPFVLTVVMSLIVLGGLGFAVLGEILTHKKNRLSLHTKLAVLTTGILILGGAILFLLLESSNPDTFAQLPFGKRVVASFFQSITPRTAGFDAVGQNSLTQASKTLTMILMFIGASPASTGGGIKTVTFAVLVLQSYTIIRNRQALHVFGRKINDDIIKRSFCVLLLAMTFVMLITLIICVIETETNIKSTDIAFEVISAMSTTGLSVGITTSLADASKILLCLTMFGGRVGLLTLALILGARKKDIAIIKYPSEEILVG